MPIKKYLDRDDQFNQMLRSKRAYTPTYAAKRLNLSRSAFYNLLSELKEDYNFPIAYSHTIESYFYTEPGEVVNFNFKRLTKN